MGKGVSDADWLRDIAEMLRTGEGVNFSPEAAEDFDRIADRLRALDKPTEEDVERVARALYAASGHEAERVAGPDCFVPGYDEDDEDAREFCRTLARAAIAALQDGV